ncbi:Cytochrome c oxidase subunit 6a [Phanerochaete sordida]|uniref:Cytochrome c oxidase subunit 13, mitochondrial n=1 Tax=Phanerochaete sordida TaxID=48140 RepID=A0A9P3G100_9APHY|nr:Cytochrome c oxidase subunit 6a [Phanerochaete sordida]
MSMLFRRQLLRAAPRARTFASSAGDAAKQAWQAQQEVAQAHAAETSELWRKISFYVCFPGIAVTCLWVYRVEAEHAEHEAHLKHENDGKLPEPPAYEYLNIRHRPFPWGMNSLFFNPEVNKDVAASD